MLTMFMPSSGAFVLEPRSLSVAGGGAMAADDAASNTACCMICGCPGGPCTQPVAHRGAERQAGCPFDLQRASLPKRGSRGVPEPLSIAMACLLLVGGFIYLTV